MIQAGQRTEKIVDMNPRQPGTCLWDLPGLESKKKTSRLHCNGVQSKFENKMTLASFEVSAKETLFHTPPPIRLASPPGTCRKNKGVLGWRKVVLGSNRWPFLSINPKLVVWTGLDFAIFGSSWFLESCLGGFQASGSLAF